METDNSVKKKKALRSALIVTAVILVLGLGAWFTMNHYLGKINYDDGTVLPEETVFEADVDEVIEEEEKTEELLTYEDYLMQNLQQEMEPLPADQDVTNILLFGTDNRAQGNDSGSRTDSMIILTINRNTKRIVMTSIMRDLYLQIPGSWKNRINTAYPIGGAALLENTIMTNFKIPIDRYVNVDFYTFMDVVDIMGGVDMELTAAEVSDMQRIIQEMNELLGVYYHDDLLPSWDAGTYHLNGKQALAYARTRYSGGGDAGRTERQRKILTELFHSAKDLSLSQLNDLADTVLPSLTTDLSRGEIVSLILDAPELLGYDLISSRIPADGTFNYMNVGGMSVLGADFNANYTIWVDLVYGEGKSE